MKLFILLSVLTVSGAVFSQTPDTTYKKHAIGLSFSSDLSYRTLNYKYPNSQIADIRNEREIPLVGLSIGISYLRAIKNQFLVEAGVFYSVKGEQLKTEDLFWAEPHENYPLRSKTQFKYLFIEIH